MSKKPANPKIKVANMLREAVYAAGLEPVEFEPVTAKTYEHAIIAQVPGQMMTVAMINLKFEDKTFVRAGIYVGDVVVTDGTHGGFQPDHSTIVETDDPACDSLGFWRVPFADSRANKSLLEIWAKQLELVGVPFGPFFPRYEAGEQLEKLGFKVGDPVNANWAYAPLPEGWTKRRCAEKPGSHIDYLDPQGRRRFQLHGACLKSGPVSVSYQRRFEIDRTAEGYELRDYGQPTADALFTVIPTIQFGDRDEVELALSKAKIFFPQDASRYWDMPLPEELSISQSE